MCHMWSGTGWSQVWSKWRECWQQNKTLWSVEQHYLHLIIIMIITIIMIIMVISGWMGHASLHHPVQHVLRVRQLRRCLSLLAQYGHRPDVSYQRLNLGLLQNYRLRPHSPFSCCHHHIFISSLSQQILISATLEINISGTGSTSQL